MSRRHSLVALLIMMQHNTCHKRQNKTDRWGLLVGQNYEPEVLHELHDSDRQTIKLPPNLLPVGHSCCYEHNNVLF